MKSVPHLVSALTVTCALALGGCSAKESDTSDIEPGQSAEVPTSDFNSTDALGDHLRSSIDEAHVHRESESNPDFDHERDVDRLHVEFPSSGQPNTDKKATADAVQGAGNAEFDYDMLMITGTTDEGTWSYMFSPDTVKDLTKSGEAVEADTVWDSADQDFDSVHR
ncbi:hypothetical protein [Brevibacterium sp. UCMA 11752]|uniref:hypothetical protein n=1 Tax=Brevibacterium sp. UCMA 11752 TaxID=2745946 RepID=UPI001F387408|nr:hypothetical protein [Brevibacterium sp. UCMA 11752]MCF2588709.1 hypothetical protein [Brevibacterium sp. UCMA 11752]